MRARLELERLLSKDDFFALQASDELTCPIAGRHRGLTTLLEDTVVNDEKRLAFVTVHESVCRIRGGYCREKREETDSLALSEQDTTHES